MNRFSGRTLLVLALAIAWQPGLAQTPKCSVGVNVNSFQNFSAADQQVILVTGPVFYPNAPLRPADEKQHMRSAMPLSYADPARNEPDRDSIYRGGALMEAGRQAVAPMPAH